MGGKERSGRKKEGVDNEAAIDCNDWKTQKNGIIHEKPTKIANGKDKKYAWQIILTSKEHLKKKVAALIFYAEERGQRNTYSNAGGHRTDWIKICMKIFKKSGRN